MLGCNVGAQELHTPFSPTHITMCQHPPSDLTRLNDVNKIRWYEVKIEESEKADSCRESNLGHLWLELPVLCH